MSFTPTVTWSSCCHCSAGTCRERCVKFSAYILQEVLIHVLVSHSHYISLIKTFKHDHKIDQLNAENGTHMYSQVLWQFFQNGWEFFDQVLHAYYAFLSTPDCEFLSNYLQLWRSYAILSVTTQFTSCAQNVHHQPKCTLAFSNIFPRQLGIFSPNFTCLLSVHIYARIQIFIQLSPITMKLCHITCDHPACVSVDGGHFEYMVIVLNMA